jgi:uncharacterized damage-inducible protein DinB
MATRDSLLAEFDHEMAATRRVLRCVPDARLAWKPHDRSRSLGALAAHLARIPVWALQIVETDGVDLDVVVVSEKEPASCGSLLSAFEEDASRVRRALDRSDAELQAPWRLARGGQEMFRMPRVAAIRSFVLGHVAHHRGQLTVYLRLNDIPVPPLYGPTADSERQP